MKKLILLILIGLLSSCVTVKYNLRPEKRIETLSICMDYTMSVPSAVQNTFNNTLSDFILKYNSVPHAFRLSACNDASKSSLRIYVRQTKLISTGEQVISTIATVAGLALPFILIAANAPFIVAFYYLPNNISFLVYSLSQDLTTNVTPFNGTLINSGYLTGVEKQIKKQGLAFNAFLIQHIMMIEKQYNDVNRR
jgi:hypothetical protein